MDQFEDCFRFLSNVEDLRYLSGTDSEQNRASFAPFQKSQNENHIEAQCKLG